ncbi:MAG: histidinol-phosphate transaminase [Armatimonadetes bacterium]|nr:histidinol-phosphate transaminase [Armatimonadota bacterium]
MSSIERWIRPEVRRLPDGASGVDPYAVDGAGGMGEETILRLHYNENVLGASPAVRRCLARFDRWHRYPEETQRTAREALAQYAGVDPGQILLTNGGEEFITLLCHLFVGSGDTAIVPEPTFFVYSLHTRIAGGRPVVVPRRPADGYALDVRAIARRIGRRTRLIFACCPNNPTGNLTPVEDLRVLLDTGVPVLVDEAYYEFSGQTVIPLLRDYDNLVILRTMSKWAGLAGLRVGYGLLSPRVARHLWKVKMLFNVNAAAQAAVCASLEDREFLLGNVRRLMRERDRLTARLGTVGYLWPLPSHTNFILCEVRRGSAHRLRDALRARGILIQSYETRYLPNAIRISVGTPAQSARLLRALAAITPSSL